MTVILDQDTQPAGLPVKTTGYGDDVVFIGEYRISIADFLVMAHYVLTNTNLRSDDPRRQFVKCIQEMQETDGFPEMHRGQKIKTVRLKSPEPLVVTL